LLVVLCSNAREEKSSKDPTCIAFSKFEQEGALKIMKIKYLPLNEKGARTASKF
jgi:hypothetical protein